MSVVSSKQRQLNQGQLDVLIKIYKFRFGSRELLASSLGRVNDYGMYAKLNVLSKQGLIAKHFTPQYKFAGRPAEYYLLPPGLRILKDRIQLDGLDDKAIKNSYKDKTASSQFITRCLTIFAAANKLVSLYPSPQFFTRRELTIYDYLPKQLPDGFLSIKSKGNLNHFFLELIESNMPPFVADRRLRQFIDYYENDDWAITKLPFPVILFVCENGATERRFRKQINRALSRSDSDILMYTTTLPALLNASTDEKKIWTNSDDPDRLLGLV